jgi:hypothetical protein
VPLVNLPRPSRSRPPRGLAPRARAAVVLATAVALSAAVLAPGASPVQAQPATKAGASSVSVATAPAAAKKRRPWRPTAGVKFNVPRAGGEKQFRLERQVIDAIRHARPRSTIKMAMFSFDRMQVADALIDAKRKRKVRVQVIINGHETNGAQKKLRKYLGGKRTRKSWYYQCKASCRGQGDVQHSKFVLFTQTGAAKKVVMLGSLNMKLNGAENQWNDLLTINRAPRLHDTLDQVFGQMRRDRLAKRPYLVRDHGNYRLFVLPFLRRGNAAKNKQVWTPGRDPIMRLLAPVKCTGARTDSGRTIIRVNMHAWDADRGKMIANRFRDLYAQGCDVKIMVGYAGAKVRNVFASRTKRGLMPTRSTGFDTDEDSEVDLYSHEKILLINGNYDGVRGRKVVVTGSSNYQHGGQYGDELILRAYNNRLYRQYADNWGFVWRDHTHGFSWGGSGGLRTLSGRRATPPVYADDLGINSKEWRDE